MGTLQCGNNIPTRYPIVTNNPGTKKGLAFFELLVNGVLQVLQAKLQNLMLKPIAKRAHSWITDHGNIKLVFACKLFIIAGQCSQCWKVLCTLLKEKSKPQSHPAMKPASFNNDWPYKMMPTCARVAKCYESNQSLPDGI